MRQVASEPFTQEFLGFGWKNVYKLRILVYHLKFVNCTLAYL